MCVCVGSVYTDPLWATAQADFEQRMVPIEKRISQKLRELFGSVLVPALAAAVSKHGDRGGAGGAEAEQTLYDLMRYKELFSRPVIAAALDKERSDIHKQMMRHLETLRGACELYSPLLHAALGTSVNIFLGTPFDSLLSRTPTHRGSLGG